jgi:hypothetical protein
MDGRLFAIGLNSNSVALIKDIAHLRHLLAKCPPGAHAITTDNLSKPDIDEDRVVKFSVMNILLGLFLSVRFELYTACR